ncbi:MAG: YciI family protein [Acetobacteraceae bacterium]
MIERPQQMFFSVIRHDKPNCIGLRQSERPRHLVYLEAVMSCIASGGALLDENGQQDGSVLIIDVADRAAAEEFAARDPYVAAGLFASTYIGAFRPVFLDGRRI